MGEKYNGWTNYETWLVNLWIDNEQYSQEYWQERAVKCCQINGGKNNDAIYDLRKELEEEIKDSDGRPELYGMYNDLLTAALSSVNWREIAENMVMKCDYD